MTRIRRDIWELSTEADPWADPDVLAYAEAVRAMQALDEASPAHGASWRNQAAIHARPEGTAANASRLENQCQHASWFFLPWHRMYLHAFETIVRSHMPPARRATWALPYWNYSDRPERRALPPAFRRERTPDGRRNPLFVTRRRPGINTGGRLPAAAVGTAAALAPDVFHRPQSALQQGFGGGVTGFHHTTAGNGAGPLENLPHGSVHVLVGGDEGFMSAFGTAALDPIFWLHHCNLDRLWEVWLREAGAGHANPTPGTFRTRRFRFHAPDGSRTNPAVGTVLDTATNLDYTYSGLPPAPPAAPAPTPRPESVTPPPELVGATEAPVVFRGVTHTTEVGLTAPQAPGRAEGLGAEAQTTYLVLENVDGERSPGFVYGVYVNLPAGAEPDPDGDRFAGVVSFFGIERAGGEDDEEAEAPHDLRYVFDVSGIVAEQQAAGTWDRDRLSVTFAPVAGDGDDPGALPPITVGRIALFVE